jgi:hypothetical protein
LKFKAYGPNGLIDRKAPRQPPRLNEAHRAALAKIIDEGLIPAIHGVVRWRLADLHQRTFEEFGAAVSPQTMSREVRALGYRKLLEEISTSVATGRHALLLLDQTGWRTSSKLNVPANITLVPLPPKCPELNPTENVCEFMRDNWLSGRRSRT